MRTGRLLPLALLAALGGCVFLLPEQFDCTRDGCPNAGTVCDPVKKVCVGPGVATGGSGSSGAGSTTGTSGTSGCGAPGSPCTFAGPSGQCCITQCSPTNVCCIPNGGGIVTTQFDCCSGYAPGGVCEDSPTTGGTGGNGGNTGGTSGGCLQKPYDDSAWAAEQLGEPCTGAGTPGELDSHGSCGNNFCFKFTAADQARCVIDCLSAPCPGSAYCVILGAVLGSSNNHSICMPSCDATKDCTSFGSGMICNLLAENTQSFEGICMPPCIDDPSCRASGGNLSCNSGVCACTQDSDCPVASDYVCVNGACAGRASSQVCSGRCTYTSGSGKNYCPDTAPYILF